MRACLLSLIASFAAVYASAADKVEESGKPDKAESRTGSVAAPASAAGGATVIYRQMLPNGRIVYADKPLKGARLDHTLTVEPPIRGNLWSTESGVRPDIPPQSAPTPIRKMNVVPAPGQKRTVADAESEVIRAEMLLEDAKKRQQAGLAPRVGERSAAVPAASRLTEDEAVRQKALERDVESAEAALRQAIAERDALLHVR
jgi:hypothetical protein